MNHLRGVKAYGLMLWTGLFLIGGPVTAAADSGTQGPRVYQTEVGYRGDHHEYRRHGYDRYDRHKHRYHKHHHHKRYYRDHHHRHDYRHSVRRYPYPRHVERHHHYYGPYYAPGYGYWDFALRYRYRD